MTRRTYSVVVVADGLGYLVVRVPAGVESLRPMPVVVVGGPFPSCDAADQMADDLEDERAGVMVSRSVHPGEYGTGQVSV